MGGEDLIPVGGAEKTGVTRGSLVNAYVLHASKALSAFKIMYMCVSVCVWCALACMYVCACVHVSAGLSEARGVSFPGALELGPTQEQYAS